MGELSAAASVEAALLTRARRRDPAAVDALYVAHVVDARRLAVRLAGAALADDLVADSFARVISQLHSGRGPSEDFRSYLLATIRNRFRDVQRRAHRERPVSHQSWILEGGVDPVAGPETSLERSVEDDRVAAAFDSLPQDWREVLWHVELRGRPVPEAAELMGLSPAAVSSLAYRAREGLRLAFLDQLLDDPALEDRECRWVRERLSRYLRDKVSDRAGRRIELHLDACRSCSHTTDALNQVNRRLAAVLLPAALAYPAKLALAPSVGAGSTAAGTAAEVSTWSCIGALKTGTSAAALMVGVTASTLSSVPVETAPPGLTMAPVAQVAQVASVAQVSGVETAVARAGATGRRQAVSTLVPAGTFGDRPAPGSPAPTPMPQAPPPASVPVCPERVPADPPLAIGAVLGILTAPLEPLVECLPDLSPEALPVRATQVVRELLDEVGSVLPSAVVDLARDVTDALLPQDGAPDSPPSGPPGAPPVAPPAAPAGKAPDGPEPPRGPAPAPPKERSDRAPGALERLAETGRNLLLAVVGRDVPPSPGAKGG